MNAFGTQVYENLANGVSTEKIWEKIKAFGCDETNFNVFIDAGEVIEWQSKMDSNGLKIKKVDFVSTFRRIHSSNFGKTNQNKEFKDYAAILRAKLKKQI